MLPGGTPSARAAVGATAPRKASGAGHATEAAMKAPFRDRLDAGRQLGAKLAHFAGTPGLLVLGLPRGGVVVAHEVARELRAPLDILVVRKLGVPCQEELAMGAIGPGGVCVLNDEVIDLLDIETDAIGVVRLREERELERRELLYRGNRPAPDLRGRTLIVVDDGIATGSSMQAAVLCLHQHDPGRVVVAAPVVSRDAVGPLQALQTEVVALITTDKLRSVGGWFEDFSATSDAEVCRLLGVPMTEPMAPESRR